MVSKYSFMGFMFSIMAAFPSLYAEYDPFSGTLMPGQEKVYLMDYLTGKDTHYGTQLKDVPAVDCTKINALSEAEFAALIQKAKDVNYCIFDTPDDWNTAQDSYNKVYELLVAIDQCKKKGAVLSLLINDSIIKMPDVEFNAWVEESDTTRKEYDEIAKAFALNQRLYSLPDGPFYDHAHHVHRFIIRSDSIEELKRIRGLFNCEKQS
jgi:hypothetical protein